MCFISVKEEEDERRGTARAVRRRQILPRHSTRQIIIKERRSAPRAPVIYVGPASSIHSIHPPPPPELAPSVHGTHHSAHQSQPPTVIAQSVHGGTARSVSEHADSKTIEVEEEGSESESGSSASGTKSKTSKSRHSHAPSQHSASRSRAPSNAPRSEYDIIDREYEHRRERIHPPNPYDTYRYVQAPPDTSRDRKGTVPRSSYGEEPRMTGASYRRERERIVIQDQDGRIPRGYRH